jgi:tRNA pseudouridine38-40 synthase
MAPSSRKPAGSWTNLPAEPPPAPARRYALGIEYDGTAFSGWQNQSHAPSVQGALNAAIARVADEPVSTLAAGRTDAGVHATGQVVHFDSAAERSLRSWQLGINSNLPPEVCVLWVRPVPPEFHARHSAVGRTYRYLILNRPVRPALERHRTWWVRDPLDAAPMAEAGAHLLGEHDFSAFRAASCQAKSPVRRMDSLTVRREGEYLVVDVRASGFLHHMVRNIVGSLVRVGRGEAPPSWIPALLAGRDRTRAAPTAPPSGLYLAAVHYPAEFGLPEATAAPFPAMVGLLSGCPVTP